MLNLIHEHADKEFLIDALLALPKEDFERVRRALQEILEAYNEALRYRNDKPEKVH